MDSEIAQLIAALRTGTMSLEEVAQRFRERTWPRRETAATTSYLELAALAQTDPEPDIPGSFDEVDAAYEQGRLTEDEYDALAAAMSEALRAEDRRKS